ncbi:transposase [Aquirufa sp. Wall-65K1]
MKKNTEAMVPDQLYHVFNRGINKTKIFKEYRNYRFFKRKYQKYISPIADTYAYCLLGNHFHFLLRIKSAQEIFEFKKIKTEQRNQIDISRLISLQFATLFNCYAQAFNKTNERTGGLFENPFRRIAVEDEIYFNQLIKYLHFNPENHGIVHDFKQYKNSSFYDIATMKKSFIDKESVLEYFGGIDEFLQFHETKLDEKNIISLLLE